MHVSRRGFMTGTVAGLIGGAVIDGVSVRAAEESRVLRIGTSNTFGYAATFKPHGDIGSSGTRFEIVSFPGGSPQIISALNAGELDIGELGEVGPVVAQAAEVPFKIVAATEPWGAGQGIIVEATSPIRTLADLKGRKVSYTRSTNSHWVLLKALEKAGLAPADVEHVFLPAGTNIQAVLASGAVDAAVSIDTLLTAFLQSGDRLIATGADVGAENPLYYIASDAAIARKRADVALFVRTLARHVAWAHAHPEERARLVAELLHIDADVALIAERKRPARLRPIDDGLKANNQHISDAFLQQGLITRKLDAAASFTDAFNQDASS